MIQANISAPCAVLDWSASHRSSPTSAKLAISREDSQRFLDFAFWYDFERNGPRLYRMCGTMLKGWKRCRDYPDPRVRERFEREVAKLRSGYIAALWAMEHQFRSINSTVGEQIRSLRKAWKRNSACPRGSVHISWVGAPRRTPPGRGQNLRTSDVRRTHKLGLHRAPPLHGARQARATCVIRSCVSRSLSRFGHFALNQAIHEQQQHCADD